MEWQRLELDYTFARNAKVCHSHPELEDSHKVDSLRTSGKMKKNQLYKATKFMTIYYGNPKKLMHGRISADCLVFCLLNHTLTTDEVIKECISPACMKKVVSVREKAFGLVFRVS